MKTLSTVLLAALTAFTLACGYSSKSTMPAQPGSMPAISALAPNTMTSRGPSFVLTVNGKATAEPVLFVMVKKNG